MRFSGNTRKYYLCILARIIGVTICIGVGALAGIFFWKFRVSRESDKKRIYICTINKKLGAGQIIKKTDVRRVSVIREDAGFQTIKPEQCIGKQVKEDLPQGSIILPCMLSENLKKEEMTRKVPYTFIQNTASLKRGDSIDVRISFPNGADFVLLGKKKVINVEEGKTNTEGRLWLALTEEEILRMSSGVVDAYLSEDTNIYAVIYVNELQEASVVNYPVNEVVEKLIRKDPNIIKIAQDEKTFALRDEIYKRTKIENKEGVKEEKESLIFFD